MGEKTKLLASHSFTTLHKGENVFERISKSPSNRCVKHEDMNYEVMFNRSSRSPLKNVNLNPKAPQTPQTQLHEVTFSTPRSLMKSSPRAHGPLTPTKSRTPILKKLSLKADHSFSPSINSNSNSNSASQTQRVRFAEPSPTKEPDRA